MSIVNWPDPFKGVKGFPGFSSYTLKLIRKSVQLLSPFTGRRQVVAYPFALWNFSGKFSTADLNNASLLRTFFGQLQGSANKFRLPLPEYSGPTTGYIASSGIVSGAGQTGNSLVTNNWVPTSVIFNPGDYFTVNDEIKIIRSPVSSNGSGVATITFDPPLKASPLDQTQLRIGIKDINLSSASTIFTNTSVWSVLNAVVLTTSGTDPLGATITNNLVSALASGAGFILQSLYVGNLSGRTITASFYVKFGNTITAGSLFLVDSLNNAGASTAVTFGAGWARYTTTFTWPATAADTVQFGISFTATGTPQNFWVDFSQIEEASTASVARLTTTGEGPVTALLALTADDGASWDLSPPILYQFSLDAQEAFE